MKIIIDGKQYTALSITTAAEAVARKFGDCTIISFLYPDEDELWESEMTSEGDSFYGSGKTQWAALIDMLQNCREYWPAGIDIPK